MHVSKALRFDGGVTLSDNGYDALVGVSPHVRVLIPLSAGGAAVKVEVEKEVVERRRWWWRRRRRWWWWWWWWSCYI